MSVESLVQIFGGLTGIGVAYLMHRFVERKYERIDAALRAQHKIDMEKIRQQKEQLRKNK
jgi:hypothetical protein